MAYVTLAQRLLYAVIFIYTFFTKSSRKTVAAVLRIFPLRRGETIGDGVGELVTEGELGDGRNNAGKVGGSAFFGR